MAGLLTRLSGAASKSELTRIYQAGGQCEMAALGAALVTRNRLRYDAPPGLRHGRACPGHPRLSRCRAAQTWMPGTRPGMTGAWDGHRAGPGPRSPAEPTEGAPAAWADRSRRRRRSRHLAHDRRDPRRLRALRLRAGGDAGRRIYRRAGKIPARPGSPQRGRVFVPGRRRAVAVVALRPYGT